MRTTVRHNRIYKLIICMSMVVCLDAFPEAACAQSPADNLERWASPRDYIAGTERTRLKATQTLGVAKGRVIIAYLSIGCGDCDAVVPALNKLSERYKVIGVVIATNSEAEGWRKKHKAVFPVRAVSERTFEHLGAAVLPTLVLFENGKAVGARAPSLEEGK